jgi:hypothetical protein
MPPHPGLPYRPDERTQPRPPWTTTREGERDGAAGALRGHGPGCPEPRWSAWFDGLQLISDDAGRTTISGPIADQAALHGLLTKIRDLGLTLLEVRCTDQ